MSRSRLQETAVIVGGREIHVGEEFDIYFHRSYKGDKLYLIGRSDTGLIVMPENGNPIYVAASKANIIEARVKLLKLVHTARGTAFAVVRPLEWRQVI